MALTPSQLRAIETFVDLGIMGGRKSVVPNWGACAAKSSQTLSTGTYAWLNDIPVIVGKQGGGYSKAGVASSSYQITSELIGLFLEIAERDIRNDSVGVYGNLPGALGKRIEEFPQKNIWDRFKEGDQVTYSSKTWLSHDGLALFHDTHLTNGRDSSGGTYDNNLTGTALTKANFEVALAAMANLPDQQGEIMNQSVTHLIVPPQLQVTGADILLAQTISTGGQNTSGNDMLAMRGRPRIELVTVPELAGDATTWYLTSMADGGAPIIWQETVALHVIPLTAPTDRNVVEDDVYIWASKGESGFGIGDPRRAIRCIA
jgi:phage major head subunit gpT-like protein